MRSFLLLALLFTCGFTKAQTALDGTWVPIRQEMGGKALPPAAFSGQKLIIKDSTYTVIAESVDKGAVVVNGKQLDIYGKEGVNKNKHFTAIFKMENGRLMVCYNLAGTSYPRGFDTTGQPLFFLSVFKKEEL